MYAAPPASAPVQTSSLILADAARKENLVICIGAGVSVAADASLPSGTALSEKLDAHYRHVAGYRAPEAIQNLIAVADAAASLNGGLEAVQNEVLRLARFLLAVPNYGHQVLALLLAEGAITLLSWNWDTCVERAQPQGERVQVVRTPDDMRWLPDRRFAKVHGCAEMPRSLLITSSQLDEPPPWAEETFAQQLHSSEMVFVGIGDVADYAQRRLSELVDAVAPTSIRVVSRSIRTEWDSSVWKALLPDLASADEDRRVEMSADEFLDDLGRAWLADLRTRMTETASNYDERMQAAVQAVLAALLARSAVLAIMWCRAALAAPTAVTSAVRSTGIAAAMLATAVLVARHGVALAAARDACWRLGDGEVEVLVVEEVTPSTEVRQEAERRTEILASQNQLRRPPTFLVAGPVTGPLASLPDIFAEVTETVDIIDGPDAYQPEYLVATELLREAA